MNKPCYFITAGY